MKKGLMKNSKEAAPSSKTNNRLYVALLVFTFILLYAPLSFASPTIYTYDESNRLIYENRDTGVIEYLYDVVGNLTGRNFYANYFTLSVEKTGDGNGTVTGDGVYQPGTYHQITATADANSTFAGWSGDCSGTTSPLNVLMDKAKTCTAQFRSQFHELVVDMNGQGNGTVSSAPAGINCDVVRTACVASFAHGATVTLTATPDASSGFAGWSGGCSGFDTCTVTMNDMVTVEAIFSPIKVTSPNGGESFSAGDSLYVYWNVTGTPYPVKVELYKNGVLNTTLTASTSNSGYYYWPVPVTQTPGTDYKIKVTSTVNSSWTDSSNANFTITNTTYTLTVGKVGLGTVTSSDGQINCGSVCSGTYVNYTTATLTATPTANDSFTGWSGNCSGTGACVLAMTSAKAVIATFQCQNQPVRINRTTPVYYSTLQAAYNAAADGETIQSQSLVLTESPVFNLPKTVTISGGYDCSYASIVGKTTVKGLMRVSNGTVKGSNIEVSK